MKYREIAEAQKRWQQRTAGVHLSHKEAAVAVLGFAGLSL